MQGHMACKDRAAIPAQAQLASDPGSFPSTGQLSYSKQKCEVITTRNLEQRLPSDEEDINTHSIHFVRSQSSRSSGLVSVFTALVTSCILQSSVATLPYKWPKL